MALEISIAGPFTKEEVVRILKLVREIESAKPEKNFSVFLNCPEWGNEETKELLRGIFPNMKISSIGPPTMAS